MDIVWIFAGTFVHSLYYNIRVLVNVFSLTVQFTNIPLPSKLFKLLVKDLDNAMEATQAGNHGDDHDSNASSEVS